jgi:hypothetical protein
MTSEMGDMFNAMREASREKRAQNRVASLQILIDAGFSPEVKNDGAHLRMNGKQWAADLWPGTGLWYVRVKGKPQREGRGVQSLMARLRGLQ